MKKTAETLELILHDKVQQLLDNFATVMHISAVFFTNDGRLLRRGGRDKGNSRYCSLLQSTAFPLSRCVSLDNRMQALCRRDLQWKCYRCHGGLNEVLAPVVANGKLAGFILFGQFRTEKRPPAELEKLFPAGIPKPVLSAFRKLPYFAPADLQNLIGLLELMVDYIVTHELVTLRGDAVYESVMRFIDTNYRERITVADAARHVGKSVSGLSHYLETHPAKPFKTLLIGRRLRAADELLRGHPEWSLKTVSAEVGIDDHYYFSRLYRKYRGRTPGDYRRAAGQREK